MALKILQLISSAGLFGAENVLLELSSELKGLGHSVTVGVFNNLHHPNLEVLEGARKVLLDTQTFDCRGKFDSRTIREIGLYARRNLIDIIHSHGYKSNLYAVLSNFKNRKPLVTTCHNWINGTAKMRAYTVLDKVVLKRFDQIIPVAKNVKEELMKAGVKEDKISLIGNGINLRKFKVSGNSEEFKKRLISDASCKVIGTISRLAPEKGLSFFLDAAKIILGRYSNVYFLIVGEGEQRGVLEDKAKTLGIGQRTIFTGRRSDISEILSMMDVFVLPSLTEGQPMSLLEAMAARKAIVATDVGDVSRILKNGTLGLIVPPRNPEGIAEKSLFFLNSVADAEKFGRAASQEASEHYSSARMAGEYLKVYHRLLLCE